MFRVLKKGLLVNKKLLVRYIVNYRALNIDIVKNKYLLPLMLELKNRIQRAKILSKIDLQVRFNLVRITEEEEYKIAFKTRYKLYKYLVMLIRSTNILVIF